MLTSGLFNRLEYRASPRLQLRCVTESLKIMAREFKVPVII